MNRGKIILFTYFLLATQFPSFLCRLKRRKDSLHSSIRFPSLKLAEQHSLAFPYLPNRHHYYINL